jgi:hypothetical protein
VPSHPAPSLNVLVQTPTFSRHEDPTGETGLSPEVCSADVVRTQVLDHWLKRTRKERGGCPEETASDLTVTWRREGDSNPRGV